MAHISVKDYRDPGWAVAQNLGERLQKEFKGRMRFRVYREYGPYDRYLATGKEEYHIIAEHPRTGETRFRRLVTLEELMSDEGYQLLMTQLYLVEPPA